MEELEKIFFQQFGGRINLLEEVQKLTHISTLLILLFLTLVLPK
jgi:hypothetical protein